MPDRPETWAWLAAWFQLHFPAFYAGALGFFVAFFRIIYGGGRLRRLCVECPLCGLLGIGAHYGTEMLGWPPASGSFIACIVGLLGVETSRAIAKRYVERKVDNL